LIGRKEERMIGLTLAMALQEFDYTHESFDGFKIEAKLALPKATQEDAVKRVVILVGGSGGYDMDLDLSSVTKGGKKNLWLKDVSDALAGRGFAVLRYNKRPFQVGKLVKRIKEEKRDPTAEEIAHVKRFQENPLQYYVEDCKSFAEGARKRFPNAKVHLFGGSEGTHVVLWAAHELKWIAGAVLVGFYARSLDVALCEQYLCREEQKFRELDLDGDGAVTKEELKKNPQGVAWWVRLAPFDHDKDGRWTLTEYKALLLASLTESGDFGDAYRIQESKYPTMSAILKSIEIPVLFFQGLLDNQTPAYNAQAMEHLARTSWKRENLKFWYFPKLGHCLDPRDSYYDVIYSPVDPGALAKMAEEMEAGLR